MAATEQPLKKRKLYDPPPSSPPPQPPPPPQEPPPQPLTPPPFSQEEILRRRRSQEEIRNAFDCYKRIKFFIDQKDKHFMPELEEAYRSLITASGGAASVQRLVAEYIPRYASYCPTALEAAGNAVINMHNQCSTMISRGEDIDGIAFETAKACISGLVDICQAAASDTPTSEFIHATRSAVFLNVFTFFASSFEGKSIFDVIDQKILKIYDVAESLSDFKREVLEEDNPILLKLSKFCTLSFLRIFFNFPKYSLVTCFELLESTGVEGIQKGKYLLQQFTVELNYVGANHMDGRCNDELFTGSSNKKCQTKDPVGDFPSPKGNPCISALRKNCLLGMVLSKDPSLKRLIFSRYKVLHDSASSEIVSDTTSILEGVFESFVLHVKEHDNQVDTVEGTSVSSKCRDPGDMSSGRMFMPRELLNRQSFSPRARTPRDFRNNPFNNRSHSSQIERNPIPNSDLHLPALRPSTGSSNSPFESPNQNIPPLHSSADHAIWYSDGDPAAMDIFPASRQLWLGSLGPDASEMHIRFQFEKFGIIDQLRCFPFKGFATVEYRNIMDALKAREVMRGRSPWGACLRVKFLDSGLGTRGAINGTAVGSSCHVYIGNVPSIWAKDEMMHEVKKVLHNGPRMVFDLSTEGALLMEFNSPEEATIAIAHLRWHRKENSNYFPPHAEGPKPASTSLHVDMRNIGTMELTSPRMSQENRGPSMQSAHAFQSPWTGGGTMEVGRSGTAEQPWMYGKPESGMHSGGGIQNSGQSIAPPQPVQASAFNRPVYAPPNSSWDARGPVHHPPLGPMYSGAMPTNAHANLQGPPFLPASVTPLSQIQGSSMAPFNQMYSVPVVPPPLSSLPPLPLNMPPPIPTQSDFCPPLPLHPELQPPLPPTPPPAPPPPPPPQPQPHSHSPAFIPPPPPSSSPSPPLPASVESFRSPRYPWQGILSKSGVHYCTIQAQRVDSDICNYSSAIAEPAEWPAKLDITKRTDLRHVKSTFSSTPRHRREICWLLPSSHGDHKGLQDFISYLKQRDCAGVIKIPAAKSMWARLLFILPYSPETCSLLSIPPNPSLCLIGLVLPKETNSE